MRKLLILLLLCNLAGFAAKANAVSEAAALFLLIQPSVRANGMAGTSVASLNHGALSIAFNPAHIGIAAFERSVNLEFYPSKTNWLPQFNIKGLTFDAKSLIVGYDLRRLNKHLPVSVGAGYTRIKLNLGTQTITDETGPEPIGTFESFEDADIWTIGVGIDYLVKIGFGFNFKNIDLNLGLVGAGAELEDGKASANVHDFGLLVQLPILETVSKLSNRPIKFGKNLVPFFTPALGFSKSNIGDKIVFFDVTQGDPPPRVARVGISLNTGLVYAKESSDLRIAGFEWSSEAEDLLVKRDADGSFSYEGGIGDIDFFDNVLKGNSTQNIITRQGWELNILDIFTYRQGNYEDPDGSVFYDTAGFGLSFIGALRFARFLNPEIMDNPILRFLSNHTDIEYNHSSFDANSATPLANTTFNAIKVSFF